MASTQLSYVPQPHEQAYYEGLFQTADVQRKGVLGGAEAVGFFSRSKLQIETLKQIWTVSDQGPATNSLDRRKFAIAVRLIQLAQNGVKAQGANLSGPPTMRPVMFEGVSGVSVPMPGAPGANAPPPQQQQQAPPLTTQPPPQQQQAPPLQQQQGPPSDPATPAVAPVMSTALTAQDPYSLPPQEQARYESLFSNYAKPDGFVYGKEAVELFGKSGVAQDQLRIIWNMVDQPVDNRLDKLEFAMAMHLIVCVSKKGLPMPSALPFSLKQLKQGPGQSAEQRSALQTNPEASPGLAPQGTGGPPALPSLSMASPPQAEAPPQQSSPMPPPQQSMEPQQQTLAAAPGQLAAPVVGGLAGGGMDISDAFEGLSATDTYSEASYGASASPTMNRFASAPGAPPALPSKPVVETIPEPSIPEPETPSYSAPAPAPIPTPAPVVVKSSQQLAAEYNEGDSITELGKLKTTLQKLQAENISLKAQLGSMTAEEKEVQKETSAVVAEIGKLSNELTDLRAQVLAAKTRLLESTAELSAAKEKKEVLTDLITQTEATKDALETAGTGLDEIQINRSAPAPVVASIPAPVPEADLFGWGDPAPAPTPIPAPAPAPAQFSAPPSNFSAAPAMVGMVGTVDDDSSIEDMAAPVAAYGFGAATAAPQPMAAPAIAGPGLLGNEAGQMSTASFGFGAGIMGGASSMPPVADYGGGLSQFEAPPVASAPAPSIAAPPAVPIPPSMNREDVEGIKQAALKAEQTSREAEDTYRTLNLEAQKLSEIAGDAENAAKEKATKAAKKGRMGGKKKASKEAEAATQDAAAKKKHYLEMQAQATNARTLAMESKKEADNLRQKAEQAELDLVAAQSAIEAAQKQAAAAPVAIAPPSNGYGYPQPAAPAAGGFGMPPQKSDSFGFGGGIMGGGPSAMPPPSGGDPYANPFE